jgi:chromosome partitioning protein
MVEDFVGIHEIAEMAGVTRQAVVNWRARFIDFPSPVADLKAGPVFAREQVRKWLRKRRIPMATVISTINLKGGVGKTTTTVAVAEILSVEFNKKVLIIDIDPQTNATAMLIGEEKWKKLNQNGNTLAQLFKDALDPDNKKFEMKKTLQHGVSNVGAVQNLSLIPSSLDLIDVQDQLATMPRGRFHAQNPTDILLRAVRPIIDEFDIVFIDCPPSLGIITFNALRMSNYYIIPTIPDILSTYGIPQIISRVREFSQAISEPIEPLGIVATLYRAQSTVHNNQLRLLKSNQDAKLFNTVIPWSNQITDAAEYKSVSTLRQKWGYQGQFDRYRELAEEIKERVGI